MCATILVGLIGRLGSLGFVETAHEHGMQFIDKHALGQLKKFYEQECFHHLFSRTNIP